MMSAGRRLRLLGLGLSLGLGVAGGAGAQEMPPPAPFPKVPPTQPPNSITMQDPATFPEVKMDFPIAAGPFGPTWASIEKNYPGDPAWLRQAKFGIWVHFGPQAEGESGDWYARKMYQPGTLAYANHMKDFGPPSLTGYIDVLHRWNPKKLDPKKLVRLYHDAGARFLLVQGVHHDNFDNWNSKYQPWNSVNMGPHKDLLGEWSSAAHAAGMHYGVSFHHEYSWWWYQPAFGSDATGPYAGKPYDAAWETLATGKGKWWQGYDPRLLYGINLRAYKGVADAQFRPEEGIFQDHLEYAHWYATRWALRIMDVINKYDPDFIYTDGDSTQPFSGYKTGTGYKCDCMQRVIADYYNHALATRGKVDVFSVVKFHPPANGTVTTAESRYPKGIKEDQDWIGENAVGNWFWQPNITYSARALVLYMLEVVSRDGNYAVNIPIKADGSLDPQAVTMLHRVGAWMKINGEGIYGSRAWGVLGEGPKGADGKMRSLPGGALGKAQAEYQFGPGDFRFTQGSDGAVYAFALAGPGMGERVVIQAMASGAGASGAGASGAGASGAGASGAGLLKMPVSSVTMLGSSRKVAWKQTAEGLEITVPASGLRGMPVAFRIR